MKNKNIIPILMMILLFGMISFVTNLAAPLGIVVKEQFQVSSFAGMLGNFANFVAYAIMGIPAGLLLSKIGYKRTALSAIVIGFIGVGIQYLSGVTGSFTIYLSGAFVSGFSMCMLNTVVNPMLNTLGGGGNQGNQYIQIGGTFNSLIGTFLPVLVGILIGEVTKKTAITDVNIVLFIAMGVFAIVGIVLFFTKIPEPYFSKPPVNDNSKSTPWAFPHFRLGAIAIFLYVGIEVGTPATMNFFLVDSGISTAISGTVVGTFYIMMLFGRLAGIPAATKFSSKTMLAACSMFGAIFVLLAISLSPEIKMNMPVFQTSSTGITFGMQKVPINAFFMVLTGACTSIMWGCIFNLSIEGLGKLVAAASGIFMMMVCGGGILPLIQNAISDCLGYLPSYWVIFVSYVYLIYYALQGSKNIRKESFPL